MLIAFLASSWAASPRMSAEWETWRRRLRYLYAMSLSHYRTAFGKLTAGSVRKRSAAKNTVSKQTNNSPIAAREAAFFHPASHPLRHTTGCPFAPYPFPSHLLQRRDSGAQIKSIMPLSAQCFPYHACLLYGSALMQLMYTLRFQKVIYKF